MGLITKSFAALALLSAAALAGVLRAQVSSRRAPLPLEPTYAGVDFLELGAALAEDGLPRQLRYGLTDDSLDKVKNNLEGTWRATITLSTRSLPPSRLVST